MPKLRGSIMVTKRLLDHPVWQAAASREGFSYGQSWLDLLLRANDSARSVPINGELIPVERGQLVWSLRSLEDKWGRSGEWISRFLRFCQNEGMIKVDSNRRRTIITVINYDTYNTTDFAVNAGTEPVTKPGTEPVTKPGTEPVTNTATKPVQKGKGEGGMGIGKENGEGEMGRENPPPTDFAEVPDEAEVLAFAAAWPGDLARGIPAGIPEAWTLGWFRWRTDRNVWPKKWRDDFTRRFLEDWIAGNAKARGHVAPAGKKNGGVQAGGRSPAQARFELSRELEEVQERLDAHHENSTKPSAKDVAREKELKKLIEELPK